MTTPNPWIKFHELLVALSAEGALKQAPTVAALEQFASSFSEDVDRDMYRGELGISLGRMGDAVKAGEIIGAMESPHERASYWSRLAEEQFKAGDEKDAVDSLRQSELSVNSLKPDEFWRRAEILCLNAKLLDDFKQQREALIAWGKAIDVARVGQARGPDSSDCSAVMATIAKLLAEAGRVELAKSVADSIAIPGKRNLALQLIERASQK